MSTTLCTLGFSTIAKLTMKEAAMKHNRKHEREAKKERVSISLLERIQPHAAGIRMRAE